MTLENDLVLRCRELNDVAGKARTLLENRMAALAKDDLVYTFKNRVKSPGSILSKVKRKRAEEATAEPSPPKPYEPDNVTDVWGCRYVTLYQSQIPPTVRSLLNDFDTFNTAALDKIKLIEFVIYTNRPTNDPLSISKETLDIVAACKISANAGSAGNIRPPENRKSAYSSVHLLFSVVVAIEHPGEKPTRETATFEVQVRDIFEEGWGEIQHNLIYSDKDRVASNQTVNVDQYNPLWQPHLNALKTFVDGCSQHASIIKKTYDILRLGSMPSLDNKSATSQTTDRDAIIKSLANKASPQAIGLIRDGYRLINDAQKAESKEATRADYLAAAAKFSEAVTVLGDLVNTAVGDRFERTVGYFLKIESANCLFFSKIPDEQVKSITIYEGLMAQSPEDPTVRLRLATAIAVAHRDEEGSSRAIALIKEAIPLIGADPLTGPSHWIWISCYVHLGYLHWWLSSLAQKARLPEREIRYLEDAIDYTRVGYERWQGLDRNLREQEIYMLSAHKALSNQLFFAARYFTIAPHAGIVDRATIQKGIHDLDQLNVPAYKEYYKTRDNIMHAQLAIGNREAARKEARENVDDIKRRAGIRARRPLLAIEVEDYMDEDERRNYRTAASVLADTDGTL